MPWYEPLIIGVGSVGFLWGFVNLFAMLQLSRKAEDYHLCQECKDQGLVPSWRVFAKCRNCDTYEKWDALWDQRDERLGGYRRDVLLWDQRDERPGGYRPTHFLGAPGPDMFRYRR